MAKSEENWRVERLLSSGNYAILFLNQSVLDKQRFLKFWNGANFRVLVDGAANVWKTMSNPSISPGNFSVMKPDLVSGDFDSIDPALLSEFKLDKDVTVTATPDQDFTDFTKALKELFGLNVPFEFVLAFVENSGRLDQIFANIETLFHVESMPNSKPVYLMSSESLTWLLKPGIQHNIKIQNVFDDEDKKNQAHVGLIPIDGQCDKVKSQGLKWDLDNQSLKFGSLVSTSNGFDPKADEVCIESDNTILWTMGI